MAKDRFLFISDTQKPFEARDALKFCKAVQKEFDIPKGNVYHVGDEVDHFHGSLYPKSPDASHTTNQEIKATKDKLKRWYAAFPEMKLAISNHGLRWVKKAISAEIPSQMIRAYQEIIEAPPTWVWREEWVIKTNSPFRLIHGCGFSGINGARNAAMDAGMSTVIGHLHAFGGATHMSFGKRKLWALNTGCLIDVGAYAFEYGKYSRNKPTLGVGVVIDSGLTPIFVPYERGF